MKLSSILLEIQSFTTFLLFFIIFAVLLFIKLLSCADFTAVSNIFDAESIIPPDFTAVYAWDTVSNFPVNIPAILFPKLLNISYSI